MVNKTATTATLRETLLSTISGLLSGSIAAREAAQVANLADKVLKSAELEIKYTEHCIHVDEKDAKLGIRPGPMLLAAPEAEGETE